MKGKRIVSLLVCIVLIFMVLISGCSKKEEVRKESITEKKEEIIKETIKESKGEKLALNEERIRNNIHIPYEERDYEKKVDPYIINGDLSNIENLSQFGTFNEEQIRLLSKNGFVVNPTSEEQLFYIYENNEYMKIPSFVTTDSVLHVYHVFYDYSLRTLEQEKLLGLLENLTKNMLDKSIYLYEKAKDEKVKRALTKNISYFAVAQMLLEREMPQNLPKESLELARGEYELIKKEEGIKPSIIFPYDLDYSQYKVRGHYTRNDQLKKYFKSIMWYGQASFPLYSMDEDGNKNKSIDETLEALLMTYSIFLNNEEDIKLWENIYDVTNFYVGSADDLSIYDYKKILIRAYGENPSIDDFSDEDKLNIVYEEGKNLPEPKIQGKYTGTKIPVGKQFRFMGQRYVADADIIQRLVEPLKRPVPSGLDVMAVMGSKRACEIQLNINKEQEKWEEYETVLNRTKEEFGQIKEDKWKSNMYYGWLWTLKGLLKEFKGGYPSFMTNKAWEDKSLSTALGSWAELKHDTVLYGKQSGAECGGGMEPPKIKGYVEPNMEVYSKLLWLTKYSRQNLRDRNLLTGELESKLEQFEDLLKFLINCSIKELRNEELSEEEYDQLLTYGGLLEYFMSSFAGDGMKWFEITSETDKNMALIGDIHNIGSGAYFEVGVGPASEMYVVVPIDGKLYLTRGAVFSYYEFVSEERLTDEKWQKIIKENKEPTQPLWMKNFINMDKIQIPMPAEPYSTGC
ncbi:MAG: DUF3160 domain-containing protein [Anaeromicrobium sp.]|jgi:hypothetical protein|uniref:DUF3160 domain-containing protein n=1 Tax=Anaeromicrobium sp. TaxID=1929132 RepID=UPI0025EA84B3|nr:DUF3160 domain-containing protein [Anaeromicrobium sp.]MCT4594429.1 DUF3160 domain-containing protein [Anaeromicrobium sp.]